MAPADASAITFVPIDRSGLPAAGCPALDDVAKDACAATAAHYGRSGFAQPWTCYLAVAGGSVVGTCGFTGAPSAGEVEIAYYTFPAFERRGYATEMARGLVAMARAAQPGITVIAMTLPHANTSTRILGRLGFAHAGSVTHPEDGVIWKWTLAGGGA